MKILFALKQDTAIYKLASVIIAIMLINIAAREAPVKLIEFVQSMSVLKRLRMKIAPIKASIALSDNAEL